MQDLRKRLNRSLALVALRAFARAADMDAEVPRLTYRFRIVEKRNEGVVYDSRTGRMKFRRSLPEWATVGEVIRAAFIGLKAEVAHRNQAPGQALHPEDKVRFVLKATEGRAYLTRSDEILSDLPDGIGLWRCIGNQVEADLLKQVQCAERDQKFSRARRLRKKMDSFGIWQQKCP